MPHAHSISCESCPAVFIKQDDLDSHIRQDHHFPCSMWYDLLSYSLTSSTPALNQKSLYSSTMNQKNKFPKLHSNNPIYDAALYIELSRSSSGKLLIYLVKTDKSRANKSCTSELVCDSEWFLRSHERMHKLRCKECDIWFATRLMFDTHRKDEHTIVNLNSTKSKTTY